LQTFGFRGEALSSLCALSEVHIITARDHEAPKGCKLVFETSGKLKSTQVIASQRGTTVAVETIFKNIPVRRQELEKNIKREYGKVLGILQAYACISTDVKLSVSSLMAKGKKTNVFGTKSNKTTRENIANVFGAKTLAALIALDLEFELQPSSGLRNTRPEGG
jgi:DNA mismatch repair protein PMS2